MDVFITGNLPKNENDKGQSVKLQLTALPEKITYHSSARMMSFDIMDIGAVEKPNGNELTEYKFEGLLPGEGRKNEPWIRGTWIAPQTIENYFSVWKNNGVKLKLLITESPINAYVYLKDYEMKLEGGFGDYVYTLTFVTAVDLSVSSTQASSSGSNKRPTPSKSRTYTVKKGDCLWDIARTYYNSGSQYTKIYNANKSVIESAAKKHGRSSSQNGKWIYPGTVLVIP